VQPTWELIALGLPEDAKAIVYDLVTYLRERSRNSDPRARQRLADSCERSRETASSSRARLLRVPPRNPLGQTVNSHVVWLRRVTLI